LINITGMKILFECRSITPSTSCGIENFAYAVIRSVAACYPESKIVCSVPSWGYDAYRKVLQVNSNTNIVIISDPIQHKIIQLHRYFPMKVLLLGLREIFPFLMRIYRGTRKNWIKEMDNCCDVVIYPYHHDEILHLKTPSVLVLHDFYDFEYNSETNLRLRAIITRNVKIAKAVICCWPEPFEQLNRRFPEKLPHLYMIPFLMDRPDFSKYTHIQKKERQFIFASSTAKHKNHIRLIEALGILKKKGHEKITIICPGKIYTESFKEIENKIIEQDVEGWIKFLGFIDREDIYKAYCESIAVISPTTYEAFSGAILEGFQAGLPVACSRIKQLELFIDTYLKVKVSYFDPLDTADIANAIEHIFSDYLFYQSESLKAKKFLENLTEKSTADSYYKVLLSVLN